MNKGALKYIVVEGPIGVGKTLLAKRLATTFNTELLLENALDNPFLPKFYEDPKNAALPTQLHFLFQRLKIIEVLRQLICSSRHRFRFPDAKRSSVCRSDAQ